MGSVWDSNSDNNSLDEGSPPPTVVIQPVHAESGVSARNRDSLHSSALENSLDEHSPSQPTRSLQEAEEVPE